MSNDTNQGVTDADRACAVLVEDLVYGTPLHSLTEIVAQEIAAHRREATAPLLARIAELELAATILLEATDKLKWGPLWINTWEDHDSVASFDVTVGDACELLKVADAMRAVLAQGGSMTTQTNADNILGDHALGEFAVDRLTGIDGVLIAVTRWHDRSAEVCIQRSGLDSNGDPFSPHWFPITRLSSPSEATSGAGFYHG